MKPRLLIESAVLEFVAKLRKRDREFLLRRFEAIRTFPRAHADYRTRDARGRDIDGHIAGRFAIVFWNDLTDQEVKIFAVAWADERA